MQVERLEKEARAQGGTTEEQEKLKKLADESSKGRRYNGEVTTEIRVALMNAKAAALSDASEAVAMLTDSVANAQGASLCFCAPRSAAASCPPPGYPLAASSGAAFCRPVH